MLQEENTGTKKVHVVMPYYSFYSFIFQLTE